jgi:hypothetical protein
LAAWTPGRPQEGAEAIESPVGADVMTSGSPASSTDSAHPTSCCTSSPGLESDPALDGWRTTKSQLRHPRYYAPSASLVFYYGGVGYRNGIVRIGRFDTTMS